MIKILKNKNIEFRFFDKTFKNSTHVYGVHRFNENKQDERQAVLNNYQVILNELNAKHLLILHHVYGATVIDADQVDNFNIEPDADAAVTSKQSVVLSIQSADCIPVLLADNEINIIGAAHCSWHCVKKNILENTINLMKSKGAKNICAIIGPGIAQASYEVDLPFYEAIISQEPKAQSLFIAKSKPGYFLFNLPGFCLLKLQHAGIFDIIDLSEDTFQNPDKYYSYRRDKHLGITGQQGNLLSTIMIREKSGP